MDNLVNGWKATGHDDTEITRRLIDLFFVAVLLDAGAGDVWKFTEPGTENEYGRSEGIAVAALYMFKAGTFSDGGADGEGTSNEVVNGKCEVLILDLEQTDKFYPGHGLASLDVAKFRKHFQISAKNEIISDISRVSLLQSVGRSLLNLPEIFGDKGRPGNIVGKFAPVLRRPHLLIQFRLLVGK